jgi:hypothetical protein
VPSIRKFWRSRQPSAGLKFAPPFAQIMNLMAAPATLRHTPRLLVGGRGELRARNLFLDRALLVGTMSGAKAFFFQRSNYLPPL